VMKGINAQDPRARARSKARRIRAAPVMRSPGMAQE